MNDRLLVLWDGDCAFCRQCVVWLEARAGADTLTCVPYQQAEATLPPDLAQACQQAVHVVSRQGEVLRAGRAVLFIGGEIGWRRASRLLALPPFVWCVEGLYRIVARHRTLFSRLLFPKDRKK